MRLKKSTVVVLVFFVIFDSMVLWGTYLKHQQDMMPVSMFMPAPNFTWRGFDGSAHNLRDLTGKVVVLHFWAAWCPPCRDEFPKLIKAAQQEKDVIFLTLSSDDNRVKPEEFIKHATEGMQVPDNVYFAWDKDRSITYEQFLTVIYPETIIIDPNQQMRRKFPGPINWEGAEIHQFIDELRQKK